jgi:hypothetical protein
MRKKLYEGFCDINEMVAPTAALIITLLLGGILQIITSDMCIVTLISGGGACLFMFISSLYSL